MAFDFDIQTQRFELIRDQVAAIIFTELQNQLVRRPTETEFGAGIWLERTVPFDHTDLPAVKVYFASAAYDQDGRASSQGLANIHVEVTTNAKASADPGSAQVRTDGAGAKAALICQKLIGAIRFILKHPTYYILSFVGRPFIKGITITDIRIAEPTEQTDGFRSVAGQLILQVRYEEDNGDLEVTPAEIFGTTIKLDDTEKGFKLEKIV
jgi:hypothetical protein